MRPVPVRSVDQPGAIKLPADANANRASPVSTAMFAWRITMVFTPATTKAANLVPVVWEVSVPRAICTRANANANRVWAEENAIRVSRVTGI